MAESTSALNHVTCPRCGGAQYDPEKMNDAACDSCGGGGILGVVSREMSIDAYGSNEAEGMPEYCPRCQGTGHLPEPMACEKCGGLGEIEVEVALKEGVEP